MKFLDAELSQEDGTAVLSRGEMRLRLPPGQSARVLRSAASGTITLGVRPEAIRLRGEPAEDAEPARVCVTEPAGHNVIVDVRLGDDALRVRGNHDVVAAYPALPEQRVPHRGIFDQGRGMRRVQCRAQPLGETARQLRGIVVGLGARRPAGKLHDVATQIRAGAQVRRRRRHSHPVVGVSAHDEAERQAVALRHAPAEFAMERRGIVETDGDEPVGDRGVEQARDPEAGDSQALGDLRLGWAPLAKRAGRPASPAGSPRRSDRPSPTAFLLSTPWRRSGQSAPPRLGPARTPTSNVP